MEILDNLNQVLSFSEVMAKNISGQQHCVLKRLFNDDDPP